jgi:pyruvate dehydrogenase E2 component (dihydrolipoamide acetyltransferase)
MAVLVQLGQLSPTMSEGVLAKWRVEEGAKVQPGDILAEVETDKAVMELEAFDRGVLLRRLVGEGAKLPVGAPIGIIGQPGEDVSALVAQAGAAVGKAAREAAPAVSERPMQSTRPSAAPAPAAHPAPHPAAAAPAAASAPASGAAAAAGSSAAAVESIQGAPVPRPTGIIPQTSDTPSAPPLTASKAPPSPAVEGKRVRSSPLARKIAAAQGLDLRAIPGTGPAGRVTKKDVVAAAGRPALAAVPAGAPALTPAGLVAPVRKPLSLMRATIARRMGESKREVPHFYLKATADMDRAARFREEANADASASGGAKISFNDLIIKACALGLRAVPDANASFEPGDGAAILYHQRVDISVAVALDEGLITPVIRDADQKTLSEIAAEMKDLGERARHRKLRVEEYTGGTFSLSNLGMFGVEEFLAVINPPEGAILAVGAIRETPVVREGAVAIARRMAMTLSCDHRAMDGAIGARLLAAIKDLIEHPMRLVL